MTSPRDRLLAAAVDHVAEHGIGELTVRKLAAALGTSHRMLVYHFGSKEGLLVEVVREVERRQREALGALTTDTSLPPTEQARRMWSRLADPALAPHERLFFELYGQALQNRAHTSELLEGIVTSWLEPLTALHLAHGLPLDTARAAARLGLAVTRGLLLDLLATGDRSGADAAMELFITMWSTSFGGPAGPGAAPGSPPR